MNIQRISFSDVNYQISKNNLKKENNKTQNTPTQLTYNPIAYKDYNISFGDRLFRTPENFYQQTFNVENMPDTMASYLFADYEDRKHIPPAQMMKIIFNDINNAKSLEEVKELFPNEPLFSNLQSMKDKKYRQGLSAEISLLKEPDKSLFKNGKDDLGLYILKKIYIEGKTLKELNKDFKQDVSNYYKGISDIKYRDLKNFGITYPNNGFWHSFIATREDFPYVSVKKKDAEFHANQKNKKELTIEDINKGNYDLPKPRKYNPKEHEIKNITNAVMENFGDKTKTTRNLKRKLKDDDPKLLFIQKYMSEIMSISLDRVHASEEMHDFFENYDSIDNSSRTRLLKYWNATPEMKLLQGLIMSDTIKLFFEYYGADGNNEEFKDLINYAHSIKPEREKRIENHNKKQAYYEEIFANYQPEENEKIEQENNDISPTKTSIKSEPDKKIEKYKINGQAVNIIGDLQDTIKQISVLNAIDILPDSFLNKYSNYFTNKSKKDIKFSLSYLLRLTEEKTDPRLESSLYSLNELNKRIGNIRHTFKEKNKQDCNAVSQALVSATYDKLSDENKLLVRKFMIDENIFNIFNYRYKNLNEIATENYDITNKKYEEYKKPVTHKEGQTLTNDVVKALKQYNRSYSVIQEEKTIDGDPLNKFIIILHSALNNNKPQLEKELYKALQPYIVNNYGGSLRVLGEYDTPPQIKTARLEDFILSFMIDCPTTFTNLLNLSFKF